MSVINSVLKDLENKPSSFTPLDLSKLSDNKQSDSLRKNIWLSVVIVIAGFSIAYLYFQMKLEEKEQQVTLLTAVESVPDNREKLLNSEKKPLMPEVSIKPVESKQQVTGLQLNETAEFLELSLKLPLGAQSFLTKSSLNKYVFLITNTSKIIVTPEIQDNDWIENIFVEGSVEGVEIHFHTPKNILVETLHKEQGQSYHWVIRLKKMKSVEKPVVNSLLNKSVDSQPDLNSKLAIPSQKTGISNDDDTVNLNRKVKVKRKVKLDIKPVVTKETDQQKLQKALLTIQNSDWDMAQLQLQKLLGSRVDKAARVELLTVLKFNQKDSEMKILIAESIRLYPSEDHFKVADARQLFSEEKYRLLIERYSNKLDNLDIINLLAATFQKNNQHARAIEYYQQSLVMNPQQPRKWVSIAISQEQKAQFDKAFQSYQMALKSGSLNDRLQDFIHNRLLQLNPSTN